MKDCVIKSEPCKQGAAPHITLMKDKRIICRVACISPPCQMPEVLEITTTIRKDKLDSLSGMPSFSLRPACNDLHQEKEWAAFFDFLWKHKRVAISNLGFYEAIILPPSKKDSKCLTVVVYHGKVPNPPPYKTRSKLEVTGVAAMANPDLTQDKLSPQQCPEVIKNYSADLTAERIFILENIPRDSKSIERSFVTAHPSYLKTLGQAHSSWIFGAIAELVDNSRDAKANKLEVCISMFYSKIACKSILMLAILDDGHGMNHADIQIMTSFGRSRPETDDNDRIGRFGIGFKTGAMRLGKDALVLTQTADSRSIAFLSQSLNEGKNNLEIPIVSYRRIGQYMEFDTSVQNEDAAKYNLKIIKKISPFDKYLIGEKVGMFNQNGTGTQIYIWNLDEWGSNYSLQWEASMIGGSSFHHGGIYTRSRRIRSRPGQMSDMVPLDYSLQSYLEVIFLDPRMKIYVQGALVKSRPLAKTLNKTVTENGMILGKPIQLTLGRSQLEWEQANCGIFLYWHGRLIEAYKRVGSMVHNGDKAHGIIGVVDVTDLMDDSNDVWVHNNKQGFQDCEAYAELEKWLGEKADEYLDKYVDNVRLKKSNTRYKPDNDWVQCDKCRKWRKLNSDFDSKILPMEWFCYMAPFSGKCEIPEEKVGSDVITISTKRHGYSFIDSTEGKKELHNEATSTSCGGDNSHHEPEGSVEAVPQKRRQTTPRSSKRVKFRK